MTHFADLSVFKYHSGPHDSTEWDCPLLAVGWLEKDFEYNTGTAPAWLIPRIKFLRDATDETFPNYSFRGLHNCSFSDNLKTLQNSHINLFIPGDHCVYVAPGRVDHYLQHHNYFPPQDFIDAVADCPDPSSSAYIAALKTLNVGKTPPLRPSITFSPPSQKASKEPI